mmetsp:Transcript_1461/g.3296  ORF Transcript_1461/g.3296 Transcript_1461/m.3296 type:complete len:451 (+) Transcript_1461:1018-2370(+)
MLFLPAVDLLQPALPFAELNVWQDLAEDLPAVGLERDVDVDGLVDVLVEELHVDDPSFAPLRRRPRGRGEAVETAGHSVVEARADGEDQVGVLHGVIGVGGPVHSEHVQGERVVLVERAQPLQGGGHGDVRLLGQLLELFHGVPPDHALAGVDHRLLRLVDHLDDFRGGSLPLLGVAGLADHRVPGPQHTLPEELREPLGDRGAELVGGHVLWQVDEDGTGPAGGRDVEGLADRAREVLDLVDHGVPLGAGPGDTEHVSLLERVGSDGGGRHLPREDDHRRPVHQGVLHRGHGVRGPWAGGDEHDPGLARRPRVSLGHVSGPLLVPREDQVEVLRVVDAVEDGEDGAARVPEDRVDLHLLHDLLEDLAPGHADEVLVLELLFDVLIHLLLLDVQALDVRDARVAHHFWRGVGFRPCLEGGEAANRLLELLLDGPHTAQGGLLRRPASQDA